MKLRAFQRQIGYCITPVLAYAVVYAWLKGACPQWWFTEVLERLIPVVMGLREQMVRHWKDLRAELLPEFDRA